MVMNKGKVVFKNDNIFIGLICIISAFVFLLLGSTSSPLYAMNQWNDMNTFFTIGRCWNHGMIPYRDIWEIKGPILFVIYRIAAYISETSYFGVFIVEVIAVSLFLFFSVKLANIFGNHIGNIYMIPIIALVLTISYAFEQGGSAEEFLLWMLVVPLYIVEKCEITSDLINGHEAFFIGIFGGIIFWTKYNLLGIYLALGIYIVIQYVGKKQPRQLMRIILWAIIGYGVVSAIVISYFLYHNAFFEMLDVYFYDVLFNYTNSMGILQKINYIVKSFVITMKNNVEFNAFVFIGGIVLFKNRDKRIIPIIISIGFMAITQYVGGQSLIYYGLPFVAFIGVGIGVISEILFSGRKQWCSKSILLIEIVLCMLLANIHGRNVWLMEFERCLYPQYQFAEIIRGEDDASLLDCSGLDNGFYMASGILPKTRFIYDTQNIKGKTAEIHKAACEVVNEGKVSFLIFGSDINCEIRDMNLQKYELVAEAKGWNKFHQEQEYYLYKLK